MAAIPGEPTDRLSPRYFRNSQPRALPAIKRRQPLFSELGFLAPVGQDGLGRMAGCKPV
jgi:hypothetical protein